METVLILDVGTSGMKGALFDRTGSALFTHKEQYAVLHLPEGRVEQECADFERALCKVLTACTACASREAYTIRAVSVTSQRSSMIALDRSGNPMGNAVMWLDLRSKPICEEINAQLDTQAICGMVCTPVMAAPKYAWLRRARPEIYEKAEKLLGIHEYVMYLLCGNYTTDWSVASRSCLMDIRTCQWSQTLLDAFGIDPRKLCELGAPGRVVGVVCPEISQRTGLPGSIPVISGGGDQQCASLGLSMGRSDSICANCGTGSYATVLLDAPGDHFDPDKPVSAAAWPGKWLREASSKTGGGTFRWLLESFAPELSFTELSWLADQVPAGAKGMLMLPGDGERWSFANVSPVCGRPELVRAVMEGIAYELSCAVSRASGGAAYTHIRLGGGLSASSTFCAMLADMTELPVIAAPDAEATMRGAWYSAAAEAWYGSIDEALNVLTEEDGTVWEPQPENTELYRRGAILRQRLG